jgi:hypothetical protein
VPGGKALRRARHRSSGGDFGRSAECRLGRGKRARERGLVHARSHVERLFTDLPTHCAIVTVADGHRDARLAGSVSGHRTRSLGFEHFGQSGTIGDVYRHFDQASVMGEIDVVEPTGPETMVDGAGWLERDNRAPAAEVCRSAQGANILAVDAGSVNLFDPDSEQRIDI